MSAQMNHEPIQEGVIHGPYKDTHNISIHQREARALDQLHQHNRAIEDARLVGKITTDSYWKLKGPVHTAINKNLNETQRYWDELDRHEADRQTEDPLAGDVDKWVHPDETRSDEQIAHDEKYRVEPY
jgi:hypothetical protein